MQIKIYRLSIAGSTGLETATGNPIPNLASDAPSVAVLRMNKNHLLDDLAGVTATRLPTALIFDENLSRFTELLALTTPDPDNSLSADRFQVVFDAGFKTLNLH